MKKVKGFTLIELLVVIAIIGMLLAIIMPALGKAKTYAQEIICKTNLHQYHIATEVYTNDNDENIPDPWESLYSKIQFIGEAERFCRWHLPEYNLQANAEKRDDPGPTGKAYAGPYWPYLAVTKVNVCPLFSKLAPKYGESHFSGCIGGPFEANFGYSMNGIFRHVVNGAIVPVKKTQVASPSQTFLWAEENMWVLSTPSLSTYVLNDNGLLVDTNGGAVDCFGSFHKISKAKLAIQQDTNTYESNSGVANVLMVDGSLTWATPEDSVRYTGRIK